MGVAASARRSLSSPMQDQLATRSTSMTATAAAAAAALAFANMPDSGSLTHNDIVQLAAEPRDVALQQQQQQQQQQQPHSSAQRSLSAGSSARASVNTDGSKRLEQHGSALKVEDVSAHLSATQTVRAVPASSSRAAAAQHGMQHNNNNNTNTKNANSSAAANNNNNGSSSNGGGGSARDGDGDSSVALTEKLLVAYMQHERDTRRGAHGKDTRLRAWIAQTSSVPPATNLLARHAAAMVALHNSKASASAQPHIATA